MSPNDQALLKVADVASALGVAIRELVRTRDAEQDLGDRLLTISETCDHLRIGRTTLRNLISTGKLTTTKVGRRPRVSMASVLAYQQRRKS